METPLISTITPCFRMKAYLKRFLDDLPKQTIFDRIEVVLDHNEPDEEELGWIADFQKQYPGRLKHLVTNPVQSIGASMNYCIEEASAPLLTIWNVDDLRTDDSMEITVETFNRGADIVYGNFIVVRAFGKKTGEEIDFSKYENQPEEFTRSMLLGPFMSFRKSLCDVAGYFDEQLKSGADFDLAIRLAFHGRPMCTNKLLGYYLNEGKGASTRPNSKQALDRTAIELRYGIYDKIDYDFVADASQLNITHTYKDNEAIPIANFVPNYNSFISDRKVLWQKRGLNTYAFKHIFKIKIIKQLMKNIYKRINS